MQVEKQYVIIVDIKNSTKFSNYTYLILSISRKENNMKKIVLAFIAALLFANFFTSLTFGWSCNNHTIIAQEADFGAIDACATDKRKDFTHYVNNTSNHVVTSSDFQNANNRNGELYKEIYLLSNMLFNGQKLSDKEKQDFIHIVGDLSNPMHNVVFAGYNHDHHKAYDGMHLTNACINHNVHYEIKTEAEFIDKAVEIANAAEKAGYTDITDGKMHFTDADACALASKSVALLSAVKDKLQ